MKKFLMVLLLIPIIYSVQSQNDSAYYKNTGGSYHILSSLGSSFDSIFVKEKGRETNQTITWLPDNEAGATPADMYYVASENKLYVYGKRNILVVNPSTKQIINQLNVSNISQFYPAIENTEYLNYNHFAYNPNSKLLYCVLENASVIAIDVQSSNDSFNSVIPTPIQCANQNYYNFFIKYHNNSNKIFYVVSSASVNQLYVFRASDYVPDGGLGFSDLENLRGLEVSETRNEFYLSVDNKFYQYQFDPNLIINDDNVTDIQIGTTYSKVNSAGNILVINDSQNNIDKIFCFPTVRDPLGSTFNYFIYDFSNSLLTTKTCSDLVTSAIYDNGKVFFNSHTAATQNDLNIINASSNLPIANISTQSSSTYENNAILDLDIVGSNLLVSKESEIVTVDLTNYNNVSQVYNGQNNYFSRIAVHNEGAMVNGVWSTDLISISTSGSENGTIEIGGTVFFACHSPANNKIYFYNKHRQENSKVYIYNVLTEDTEIIEFENAINDIEINPIDNNALVSTEESSNKIKVIDGSTDLLLDDQSWIQLGHGYIGEMFISDNNKLYSIIGQDPVDGPGIEIWQLGSGSNTFVAFEQISSNTNYQISGVFIGNAESIPATEFVYAAIRLHSTNNLGWLTIINDDNHAFTSKQITKGAFDIGYDGSSYVYIAHNEGAASDVTVYNLGNETFSTTTLPGQVFDLETNVKKGYVYALHGQGDHEYTMISTLFRGSSTPFVSNLLKYSSSIILNHVSDLLYIHTPYLDEDCTEGGTTIIEILDNSDYIEHINSYTFDARHRPRYFPTGVVPTGHSLIIDNDNGYLFFGGGGHNLIHRLELPEYETLQLRENITWVSVPRHERDGLTNFETRTETVFGDEYISGTTISTLELTHNFINSVYPHPEGEVNSEYTLGTGWSHASQMYYVNSIRGYKLEITPNEARTFYMFGEQEDPMTTIDLYGDRSNWIGYFIESEQDIFDAFGSTIDDLYEIKHQDWTCIYTEVPWFGPIEEGQEPELRWYCDQPQTHIKYGEMVVVKPFSNVTGFQWYDPGQGSIGGDLSLPQNFTFEEEPDYQTYMIALDSSDNPQEIGAFSGDTCIGACVVDTQDTIAMIKGYNTGASEDSISFEPYYSTKSSKNERIREYYVYNKEENKNEKRAIRSDEIEGVYFISFKDRKLKQPKTNEELYNLTVYPNPAKDMITVEFNCSKDVMVTVKLTDIYGRLVKTIYSDRTTIGRQKLQLMLSGHTGVDLPHGMYILHLESSTGTSNSKKIMIN